MHVFQLFHPFLAFLHDNGLVCFLSTAIVLFLSYYFREVVKRPVLLCREGKLKNFLLQHCPLLHENFRPTIWYFESRLQTVIASCLRSKLPRLTYKREVVELSDGANIHLDWDDNDASKYDDPETRPTVLFLPGLTGDSQADYLRTLVIEAKNIGLRSVIFNNRGKGGTILSTAKTYCSCICSDLVEVIDHIKAKYPKAPLMGTGISLGGIILSHHLVQAGEKCKLVAAMAISIVWNVLEGTKSLERPILNLKLNNHLARGLINGVKDYRELFSAHTELDWEKILKAETIRQFDTEFTAKIFGFKGIDDYYEQSCLFNKVTRIKTPLLAISAADDPFQPSSSLPYKEVCESSHVAVVVTSRGGHIGFLDTFIPSPKSFMDRLFSQYAASIFSNVEEFTQIAQHLQNSNQENGKRVPEVISPSTPNAEEEILGTIIQDKDKDLPQEISDKIQKSGHSLLIAD